MGLLIQDLICDREVIAIVIESSDGPISRCHLNSEGRNRGGRRQIRIEPVECKGVVETSTSSCSCGGNCRRASIAISVGVRKGDTRDRSIRRFHTNLSSEEQTATAIHKTELDIRRLNLVDNNRISQLDVRWHGLDHLTKNGLADGVEGRSVSHAADCGIAVRVENNSIGNGSFLVCVTICFQHRIRRRLVQVLNHVGIIEYGSRRVESCEFRSTTSWNNVWELGGVYDAQRVSTSDELDHGGLVKAHMRELGYESRNRILR